VASFYRKDGSLVRWILQNRQWPMRGDAVIERAFGADGTKRGSDDGSMCQWERYRVGTHSSCVISGIISADGSMTRPTED